MADEQANKQGIVPPQEAAGKFKAIIAIGMDKESGQVMFMGPAHDKEFCLHLLCEAIKFVGMVQVEKSPIIQAHGPIPPAPAGIKK